MAMDLLRFGKKILVLGDPAQLPPVGRDEGFFTNAAPNYLLTEVHRAAWDHPITRIATMIRESDPRQRMLGFTTSVGNCGRYDRLPTGIERYDQVICGTNRTRWRLINKIRDALGFYGPAPVVGDRIIVLANSKDAGVFNGQQFEVLACEADPEDRRAEKWMLTVRDDEGLERPLRVWREGFTGPEGEKDIKFSGRGLTEAATFAQAITCHKSQGSEFSNVLVVDESHVFRTARLKSAQGQREVARAHEEARSWLYTAVTRASNHVSVMDVDDLLPRRR
jgi:exodeoxyribonuclease-5